MNPVAAAIDDRPAFLDAIERAEAGLPQLGRRRASLETLYFRVSQLEQVPVGFGFRHVGEHGVERLRRVRPDRLVEEAPLIG